MWRIANSETEGKHDFRAVVREQGENMNAEINVRNAEKGNRVVFLDWLRIIEIGRAHV